MLGVTKNTLIIIWVFSFHFIYAVAITEVYYETFSSKYFNQAIEIKNTTSNEVYLTNYFLKINQKISPLLFWQDLNSDHYNFSSSPVLLPGKIALILDRGYQQTEIYNTFGIPVFTIGDSSLSSEVFIKENETIEILDRQKQSVDYFRLKPTPKGVSLEKVFLHVVGSFENVTYCHNKNTIGSINSIEDLYSSVANFKHLAIVSLSRQPLIIGLPNHLLVLAVDSQNKINYSYNREVRVGLQPETVIYHNKNKITTDFSLAAQSGVSTYFSFMSLNLGIDFPLTVRDNIEIRKTNVSLPNSDFYKKMFLTGIFAADKQSIVTVYHREQSKYLDTKFYLYVWNNTYDLIDIIPVLIEGYQQNISIMNTENQLSLLNHQQIVAESSIDLNKSGVIALLDRELKVIDVVHYDYSWFSESDNLFLKRKSLTQFAFDSRNWELKNVLQNNNLVQKNEVTFEIINPILQYSQSVALEWRINSLLSGKYEINIYTLGGRKVQKTYSGTLENSQLNVKQQIIFDSKNLFLGTYIAVCQFYSEGRQYNFKAPFYVRY